MDELQAVLEAGRDREMRHNKFMAAIQGIDIEDNEEKVSKFEEVQRRVEARLTGKSEAVLEYDEFGLDIEVEEN